MDEVAEFTLMSSRVHESGNRHRGRDHFRQGPQCQLVAGCPQPHDLSGDDRCRQGSVAECLPLVDVRKMHFDHRYGERGQRIPDGDGSVGVGGGVDDDSGVDSGRLLDPDTRIGAAFLDPMLRAASELMDVLGSGARKVDRP